MICFVGLFGLQPGFKEEYQEMYNSKKRNSDIHVYQKQKTKEYKLDVGIVSAYPETEQVVLH